LKELFSPLSEQRLRCDQHHAPRAFGHELRDDEAGLDRLSQAHFVGEDAAALAHASKREDHGVDLMRVRIDLRRTLGRRVATLLGRPAAPHQIFGEVATLGRVKGASLKLRSIHCDEPSRAVLVASMVRSPNREDTYHREVSLKSHEIVAVG